MDARPQRMPTRIRDENDLAQMQAAIGHRKGMASTASSKMSSTGAQRLEQPAKRVALADATRHDATLLNKGQEINTKGASSKGGLSKPAVRPKQSTASVATGNKSSQALATRSEKPAVYRDEPAAQQTGATKGRLQGPRKRPFVFRDEPTTADAHVQASNADVEMGNTDKQNVVTQGPKVMKVSPPTTAIELPEASNLHSVPVVYDGGMVPYLDQEERIEEPVAQKCYLMEDAAPLPVVEYDSDDDESDEKTKSAFEENCSDPIEGPTVTGLAANRLYPETNESIEKEIKEAHRMFKGVRDEEEEMDPFMVAEYTEEIIAFCHILDHKYLPDPQYMNNQPHLEWSMRSTLIDWLVQVHERFRLLPETLYIAVNIVDRFLTKKAIPVSQLQLVGIVALFIAAKYEEISPPSIEGLVYMVDGAYTADDMRRAESYMLRALNWETNYPGPMNFLRRLSKADDYDSEIRTLAKFFVETTIMDERFVGAPISFVVAACYYLSMIMLNKGDWNAAHVHYGGYTSLQLGKAVEVLVETCGLPHVHHPAIFEKYSEKQYKRVAVFVERWMTCQFGRLQERDRGY